VGTWEQWLGYLNKNENKTIIIIYGETTVTMKKDKFPCT
jgi:hypothetical protein